MNKNDKENVLVKLTKKDLKKLTRKELEDLFLGEQELRVQAFKKLEKKYHVEGHYIILKRRFYLPSSEKSPTSSESKPTKKKDRKKPGKRTLLPSDRYPNAEITDTDVMIEGDVICGACSTTMEDSGLVDTTEVLHTIPKKYIIERHHHVKYKCPCCSHMLTTPRAPRIKPGSSYSDNMIIDVAMSKYCDLIPMERYASIAAREGFQGLPPNALIELTHYLANFCSPIVEKIKKEILKASFLHADETPHNMMEQVKKKQWYLWGFSSLNAAYFDCRSTRSGEVAAKFLQDSNCRYLVSDVYSGYKRAIKDVNDFRREEQRKVPALQAVFCNAHARRKFKELPAQRDGEFFIWCYKRIYKINKQEKPSRKWQQIYFEAMRKKAQSLQSSYSTKSLIYGACEYFLKNYQGLTLFLQVEGLPIDNNQQERLLRSPVVGRKTWCGTHSPLGAKTAAALFTIVESCKLNKINPRDYLKEAVELIHQGKEVLTPHEMMGGSRRISSRGSPPQKRG